ncbi:MAG: hypothetical protein J7641_11025 [Cyanobacteria bacterium SID2]|nr:hypothetical protein [Cyanobacteria bacterium SID2]MBP0002290.1 hypothetical protein [Cyanobacteria bacterium SBC]
MARHDPFIREDDLHVNPRQTALEALLEFFADQSETLQLLNDRAENDPDEQLRYWAKEKLSEQ